MKSSIFLLPLGLSLFGLAQTDLPADQPSPKAAARAEQLKAGVKSFRLQLEYHGDQDKPYYNLTLSVPGIAYDRKPAFHPQVHISEDQATKIIDYLATAGLSGSGRRPEAGRKIPPRPCRAIRFD